MPFNLDQVPIRNSPDKNRFEAPLNGAVAIAEYMDRGKMIVFTHTEVPEGYEGKGIGGKLVKFALDYAREHEKQVMPLCPYVAAYLKRHPEYQDLVLPGYRY